MRSLGEIHVFASKYQWNISQNWSSGTSFLKRSAWNWIVGRVWENGWADSVSQERADPSAKTSSNWQLVCSVLDQLLLEWRQTIIDGPSAPFPQQWHLFSSYLRTCSSRWDQQYVWSTIDAVKLSREMMFYEVSSWATIWRESHLTILGDYLSQSSDPIHWKLSVFLDLEIAYSSTPFHRWRKFLQLYSDSWIKVSYWRLII